MMNNRRWQDRWIYFLVGLGVFLLTISISKILNISAPGLGMEMAVSAELIAEKALPPSSISEAIEHEYQGREFYNQHQYIQALNVWQQAASFYNAQNLGVHQARLLSNISLAYQQLGDWTQAQQTVQQSLELLNTSGPRADTQEEQEEQDMMQVRGLAQSLNTQASLWFSIGQTHDALATWEQALSYYVEIDDQVGLIRVQINQAQALQELGHHRQAVHRLTQLNEELSRQDVQTIFRPRVLRQLGDTLRLVGHEEDAETYLNEGLTIARQNGDTAEIAAIFLSLGRTAQSQHQLDVALERYEQAQAYSSNLSLDSHIKLAQSQLFLLNQEWQLAQQRWHQAFSHVSSLPQNRDTIYSYISLSQQLRLIVEHQLTSTSPQATFPIEQFSDCIDLLMDAVEMSRAIGDTRAESYALGYLGNVYESAHQWQIAQQLTHRALTLALQHVDDDLAYRWQWQLGRILKLQGKQKRAIAAYRSAVRHLSVLRGDLIATSSEEQFRFKEEIEPVYRELVSLLLAPTGEGPLSQEQLSQARDVMEAFQIAELDNFFQEACLDESRFHIDQLDADAAVIYPIILSDRLDIILSLPDQTLHHYSIPVDQETLTTFVNDFRDNLVIRSRLDFLPQAQQLYNWLIRPMVAELAHSSVKTLTFVLDGPLRQVPMGTLHDGDHYLIESYQVAIAPGLTLVDAQPSQRQEWQAVMAGLSKARHGFSPLNFVKVELEAIHQTIPGVVLLDEIFTSHGLQQKLQGKSFPIIHIASHGQFGSKPEDTFILTWDQHLNIRQLQHILQSSHHIATQELELLVLSACETAAGDRKAPLGLAGMAVRAGARSTLATLWAVNDGVTAQFMKQVYQNLDAQMPKAEALRQAQIWLLQSARYNHPIYWAPYVLIGNWN